MRFFGKKHDADHSTATTAVPSPNHSMDASHRDEHLSNEEKGKKGGKLAKIPNVTVRTIVMTILVAMGGFIFGYDTGQISGFLEMKIFLEMFGIPTEVTEKNKFGFYFTNVRSGLIVGLVSFSRHIALARLILSEIAFNRYALRLSDCRTTCQPLWTQMVYPSLVPHFLRRCCDPNGCGQWPVGWHCNG